MADSPGHLQRAREFLRRWDEANERGRKRLGAAAPLEAVHLAARHDPDPWLRRQYLSVLDHCANDQSGGVFLAALADPVAPVREMALHGLACERCRSGSLCVADVVPVVGRVAQVDPSPEVRHRALAVLVRLSGRSAEARAAIQRAAVEDEDPLVRQAAAMAAAGGYHHLPSRARLRRQAKSRRSASRRRIPDADSA